MTKSLSIVLNALPVLAMIALIPLVSDDYALTLLYVAIIAAAMYTKREVNDMLVLVFGFGIMTVSETLFISTGVETFTRRSLFGLMPLWLPLLWAYGFVAIKRSVKILDA